MAEVSVRRDSPGLTPSGLTAGLVVCSVQHGSGFGSRRRSHLAELKGVDAAVGNLAADARGEVLRDDEHHADAHVEDAVHLRLLDAAEPLQPAKHARHFPAAAAEFDLEVVWHDAAEVFLDPAAGDVGDPVHDLLYTVVAKHAADRAGVETGGGEQDVGHPPVVEFGDRVVAAEPGHLKDDLPHKAVAVGVESARRETDRYVAGFHVAAVDQPLSLHDADAEAGKVVVALLIHVWQDGRLAADEGTVAFHAAVGNAPYDALKQRRIVAAHGDVVEEEERLGTGAEGVIHAHRHQVDAHGVVNAGERGDLELRPYSIGAGDEQRILVAAAKEPRKVEVKQSRESALATSHPRAVRATQVHGDPGHRVAIAFEVDSSAGIGGSAHPGIFASGRRPARDAAGDRLWSGSQQPRGRYHAGTMNPTARRASEQRQHAGNSLPPLQFSYPLPYGAVLHDGPAATNGGQTPQPAAGVQFVVYSRSATAMRVLLYDAVDDPEPSEVIAFDPAKDRWGDIWSIFVPGIRPGQLYHFQADGPFDPENGHRFDGRARLIDPYARALAGHFLPSTDGIVRPPKCVVVDDTFDWQGDRHLRRGLADTVIYEMHVRGFTRSPSSGVEHPGTYLGVIEKIPYLKSLGVTAVELMPVHEFPTEAADGSRTRPANYWGYDPMAFFAPHRGYAAGSEPGCQVREFKEMVRALHAAGIEVILDVVFNHTAEGNELGPTFSFKGLENRVYYMLGDGGGYYRNFSGCGNTINGNHPIVRELIFICLRHWVHNYHIDGFRFDLASILSRDRNGDILPNPPIVEVITEDPMLADTKIIAEAWDAAGAYQVGSFASLRWAEWNGHYRDDVRRYWRGDYAQTGHLATRLAGSSDLYGDEDRQPYHSINFVTSHDGFTLNDLVTYREKHNEANGEGNRDGDNNNFSDNYGVEGPSRKRDLVAFRGRQVRNFLATLLLSQGVPMLVSGDECRRTQRGNNNAYCQDNSISWFDWSLVEKEQDLVRFVRELIRLRRDNPTLRRRTFLKGGTSGGGHLPDVEWFSAEGAHVDWYAADSSLACFFAAPTPETLETEDDADAGDGEGTARHVLIFCHAGTLPRTFQFPQTPAVAQLPWRLVVHTGHKPPADVTAFEEAAAVDVSQPVELPPRGLVCMVADAAAARAVQRVSDEQQPK